MKINVVQCSNIVQSQILLEIEPCEGKVLKCISVAALLLVGEVDADHRKQALNCRRFLKREHNHTFRKDVVFLSGIIVSLTSGPMQATRVRRSVLHPRPAVVVHSPLLFTVVVQPNLLLFCCSCSNT